MKTSAAGIRLIESFEGLRLQAYPDPGTGGEPWTIGIGTTRYPNGSPVMPGDKVTEAQARNFLAHDVQAAEDAITGAVSVPLTQPQFDALVSLVYNIGVGAFSKSTLVRKLNAGDAAGAAAEFDAWINAGGQPMDGLRRRRRAERALFETATPAAPIEARTAPPAAPIDPRPNDAFRGFDTARPEKPMAPLAAALAPSLLQMLLRQLAGVVPEVAAIVGDKDKPVSERNVAIGTKILEAAVAVAGTAGPAAAVEAIVARPELVGPLREQVVPLIEIAEAGGGGIDGARKFAQSMMSGPAWQAIGYGLLLGLVAIGVVIGGGFIMAKVLLSEGAKPEVVAQILDYYKAAGFIVLGYLFGSSRASQNKDHAIIRELGAR